VRSISNHIPAKTRNGEKILVGKPEEEKPLERPTGKLDNFKMVLFISFGWIQLVQKGANCGCF
jgi:hypothetical protein